MKESIQRNKENNIYTSENTTGDKNATKYKLRSLSHG